VSDRVVLVPSFAAPAVALESDLAREGSHRTPSLFALDGAHPWTDYVEHVFHGWDSLSHPLESVRLAVVLDPTHADDPM
jgi:hypothetical protein